MNILKFLFGTKNDRELKKLWPIVREINRIESEYQARNFADDDYPRMTQEFKDRIAKGETLDHILPEAFALVKNAATSPKCRRARARRSSRLCRST